jgi:PIN domain nuclease of toxin-antitoxin system
MRYVFDASAAIAYLRNEAGCLVVRDILAEPGNVFMMHAANLCELYYDFTRAGGVDCGELAVADFMRLGVVARDDMDFDFWKSAGRLKALGRISLADTFAVTLASREDATIVTSDHHEFDPFIAAGIMPASVLFFR